MCGIAGLFDLNGHRPVVDTLLKGMTRTLSHRGPDAEGYHVDPGIGLGHRRLSIIDLSGGNQPLYNEEGSVAVVFNGEIYNFQPLVTELEQLGHRFKTRSDTEVIVHAWEAWGADCVHRFQGMFAFALWDRHQETLFLARDPLGIKPVYYSLTADGWLLFGSELKVLLHHPALNKQLDPHAVESYMALGYVPDPMSIYQGVKKLPPGHHMVLVRGKSLPVPQQYWNISFSNQLPIGEATGEALIERLKDAIKLHQIADVPVGAFLSGGVDSSAVAAIMAEQRSDPVIACTVSFGDRSVDELPYAKQVAEQFGMDHRVEQATPDHHDLIQKLVSVYDEPFADQSALPTWLVCGLARRHVKVVLSGDGGDENLAGYRRYGLCNRENQVRRVLPSTIRQPLFGALSHLYPKMDRAPRFLRAKSTFESLARDPVAGYFHAVSIIPDPWRKRLFSKAFQRDLQGYRAVSVFHEHAKQADVPDYLSLMQYIDFKTFLAGRVLVKVDRASMAHGLEVRVPILEHRFCDWMASLPSAVKLHNGSGKHILKKALEPLLSKQILYRPKMGFVMPIAEWMRGPLRDRISTDLLTGPMLDTGWFNPDYLKSMVQDHLSGRRDYGEALWVLMMFNGFIKKSA
ncbi:MAG: amidotransferase 1, exosortase A system-associated [Magnetococcales bacterium]|nr:amidotransferase 1, exosortase A system-associated [Magnetococcales bacterium]